MTAIPLSSITRLSCFKRPIIFLDHVSQNILFCFCLTLISSKKTKAMIEVLFQADHFSLDIHGVTVDSYLFYDFFIPFQKQ